MTYLVDPANWEWVITGNNFWFLLEGFFVNLEIAAIGILFSLIFGLLLALMRISNLRLLSIPAGIWVDVWRNLPLIFIILYLALSLPTSWRQAYGDAIPDFFPEALQNELVIGALVGLVLYNSAVLCEMFVWILLSVVSIPAVSEPETVTSPVTWAAPSCTSTVEGRPRFTWMLSWVESPKPEAPLNPTL